MIKSEFNPKTQEYTVFLSKADLQNALGTYDGLICLMHDIVVSTHGAYAADKIFPLEKGEYDELQSNS